MALLREKHPTMDVREMKRLAQATRWLGKLRKRDERKFGEIVSPAASR